MDAIAYNLGGFSITKLYRDYSPYDAMNNNQRAQEIATAINNGTGFINYYGHGNQSFWQEWFTSQNFSLLTNNNEKLPVVFATSCYTGRFHFERDYYLDVNGIEWNGGCTNRPEPRAIQPTKYDTYRGESLAEEFLVLNSTGAIAYIGVTSKVEQGGWPLCSYFYEAYNNGAGFLGRAWTSALNKFIDDVKDPATGGMHHYAFIHIHKMMLFGDPSLALGVLASIVQPKPDIKANDQDGPIIVHDNTPVSITISLDPGSYGGLFADWWVVASKPSGWEFYTYSFGWNSILAPCIVFPLVDVAPPFEVLNTTLPKGDSIFYFALDKNADFFPAPVWWDEVKVTVQ